MSDAPRGPSWWQASDGRWYPPEQHPNFRAPMAAPPPPPTPAELARQQPQAAQPQVVQPQVAHSQVAQLPGPPPGYWQGADGNWYPPQAGQQLTPREQARLLKANRKAMRPWYKKKRWWFLLVILLIIVLIIAIIAETAKTVSDDANKVHTAIYSVTGNGVANISYDSVTTAGGGTQQAIGSPLPWSKTVSGKGLITIFSVVAQLTSGSTVSCTLTVDGKVVSSHTSTGQDAIVTCDGANS